MQTNHSVWCVHCWGSYLCKYFAKVSWKGIGTIKSPKGCIGMKRSGSFVSPLMHRLWVVQVIPGLGVAEEEDNQLRVSRKPWQHFSHTLSVNAPWGRNGSRYILPKPWGHWKALVILKRLTWGPHPPLLFKPALGPWSLFELCGRNVPLQCSLCWCNFLI